jgi:hypothetical protein
MRKIALLILLLSVQCNGATATVVRVSHGRIRRSPAVRREFMREHPCPSTGLTRGRCPHWVVDHRVPLECGGPDSPSNMQCADRRDRENKGQNRISMPTVIKRVGPPVKQKRKTLNGSHLNNSVPDFVERIIKLVAVAVPIELINSKHPCIE